MENSAVGEVNALLLADFSVVLMEIFEKCF